VSALSTALDRHGNLKTGLKRNDEISRAVVVRTKVLCKKGLDDGRVGSKKRREGAGVGVLRGKKQS